MSAANKIANSRLQAARETITLLKNENNLLPLNPAKLKTIAVIGPNANRALLGGYSGVPKHNVTVLDGIRAKVGDRVKVLHSEGCKITVGGSWQQDEVVRQRSGGRRESKSREAVEVAKSADVIVLCTRRQRADVARSLVAQAHGRPHQPGLGWPRRMICVKALLATGKPVVAFLFNGRPLSINFLAQNVPALCECWYLGQECGHAVADVLFGDFNPGGKLPISIPRSVGHLPAFYNYKPSARRGYLFDDVSPLFPFGFRFELHEIRVSKRRGSRRKK